MSRERARALREMSRSSEENLKRIIRLMQTDDSVDAPEGAVKWSKNLYRTRRKEPSVLQRVTAVLKADLAPGKAVFGERSGAGTARQMFFDAGTSGIDLRLTKTEEGFNVRGQILGEGFEHCKVTLGDRTGTANENGEFSIDGIQPGVHTLTATGDREEITIEEIEVS